MICEIELVRPLIRKYLKRKPVHSLDILKDMISSYGFNWIEDGLYLKVIDYATKEEIFKFQIKPI